MRSWRADLLSAESPPLSPTDTVSSWQAHRVFFNGAAPCALHPEPHHLLPGQDVFVSLLSLLKSARACHSRPLSLLTPLPGLPSMFRFTHFHLQWHPQSSLLPASGPLFRPFPPLRMSFIPLECLLPQHMLEDTSLQHTPPPPHTHTETHV